MSSQPNQLRLKFDGQAAEKAKQQGMGLAALGRKRLLIAARGGAELAAMAHAARTATIEDVHAFLLRWGHDPGELGNAAGSVFKGSKWVCVGWVKSKRVSSHARAVRVWRLREP
jgi:hypothetical protein